jgi:hypothetical protein
MMFTFRRTFLVAMVLTLCSSGAVAADSASLAQDVCAPLHDSRLKGADFDLRITNCENMVAGNKFKNIDALRYTLQYFANNFHKLADSSCATEAPNTVAPDCKLCKNSAQIEQGIQNGCSMVINDVEADYPSMPNRSTGYFVDLCARNPAQNIETFYINRGTGPLYHDVDGEHSTLMGAFLTDTAVQQFHPFSHQDLYRNMCNIPEPLEVRLVGLNSSNNTSDWDKPCHDTPHNSGIGCPSVNCKSVKYMRPLAENGPSLFVSYAKSRMENAPQAVRIGQTCRNEPGEIVGSAGSAPTVQRTNPTVQSGLAK